VPVEAQTADHPQLPDRQVCRPSKPASLPSHVRKVPFSIPIADSPRDIMASEYEEKVRAVTKY
jgi:hypothetical protein